MQSKYKYSQNNSHLLYKINALLIEKRLLNPKQRILIAVSGGQDSMSILSILYKLHKNWEWRLGIIYCDHSWYTRSKQQGTHIARVAISMQINFYQAVTTQPINTEALARSWRYKLLKRLAISHNYTAIITGHNGSDRIETMIYNLIRGSGQKGLHSLTWKKALDHQLVTYLKHDMWCNNIRKIIYKEYQYTVKENIKNVCSLLLIRPLLNITRTELKKLIINWKVSIWEDATNQNLKIQRNRIRNQLFPYLRKYFNSNVDHILLNWTEIIHEESMYLENLSTFVRLNMATNQKFLSKSLIKTKVKTKSFRKINLHVLRVLPVVLQRRIIKQFLDTYFKKSFTFEQVEQIRIFYLSFKTISGLKY